MFRISSEDQIYRKHLAKPGKKYLFVLAEHYPESLSDALAIIYFPGVPRGLCTAKIYIRDEFSNVNGNVVTASGSCGGVFRKLADVTAKELAGFSIEVSRVGKSRPQGMIPFLLVFPEERETVLQKELLTWCKME